MRRDVAERISQLTEDCAKRMSEVADLVLANCTDQEREEYLHGVAGILANLTMLPAAIYREHPDLMPPELKSRPPRDSTAGSP